jgi:DNA-binding MarR family transcriptional regulator
VLNHLTRLGVSQTITEIATAMQVAQPTMSSTVKKLVQHGFVELTLSQNDARLRKVTLTRAGRAMRKRCIAATAPLHAIMTHDVAPQDWQQLLPQLRRLRCLLDDNR